MKTRSFIESFKFAINGLNYAFKKERNLKIQGIIGLIVLLSSFLTGFRDFELLWIFFAVFIVIAAELLNTLVEKICDLLIDKNFNPGVKIIKDISAGLVLLVAVFSVVIGIFVFGRSFIKIPFVVAFAVYMIFIFYFVFTEFFSNYERSEKSNEKNKSSRSG
ncbi:MAG: diacylglycerol kinase [Thermotogaceae bacterium]|jgi:diacylglycerol kinase (ATP)|nr:diacylglycerol kinase [Thermotogaceae bacterium]